LNDISIPNALLPPGIISPGAFIADKHPDLPDYGVDTGDLVIVDSGANFVNGELSAFQSKKDSGYHLSKEKLRGYSHFGKVVMVMKYYGSSPFPKI
jgi:hypothetical protein